MSEKSEVRFKVAVSGYRDNTSSDGDPDAAIVAQASSIRALLFSRTLPSLFVLLLSGLSARDWGLSALLELQLMLRSLATRVFGSWSTPRHGAAMDDPVNRGDPLD